MENGHYETANKRHRPGLQLRVRVYTQAVGTRPLIELEPTGRPLAVEQRTGIRLARVQEIAETLLHGRPDAR